MKNVLLIDGDILPYEIGFVMQRDGIQDWPAVKTAVDNRIEQILVKVGEKYPVNHFEIKLSDPLGTFRQSVATILPYKGHRKQEKPIHWDGIRAYLRERYDATHADWLEGDDTLLCTRTKYLEDWDNVIIASSDKDLKQEPIIMYRWETGNRKEEWSEVGELEAIRNFWTQMLIGDRVDNILGLFGVGLKHAAVLKLYSMQSETEMCKHVHEEYEKRYGTWAGDAFLETFILLRMLKDPKWLTAFNREEVSAKSVLVEVAISALSSIRRCPLSLGVETLSVPVVPKEEQSA